jgi:hypothetical protein
MLHQNQHPDLGVEGNLKGRKGYTQEAGDHEHEQAVSAIPAGLGSWSDS